MKYGTVYYHDKNGVVNYWGSAVYPDICCRILSKLNCSNKYDFVNAVLSRDEWTIWMQVNGVIGRLNI